MLVLLAATLVQAPAMLSRADWGAGPVILNPQRHEIRYVTIHHTGVAQKPDVPFRTKLRNLQKWCQREDRTSFAHVKPPWPDIPYHYYIAWDGQIAECREAKFVGDTNTTYDPTGHLLIVVEGNFEKEKPSEAQLRALDAMTQWAARKYGVPRVRIKGHGDYAKTDCPGGALREYLPRLRTSF
ncbi:MAG: peptidoglycan recognition family protein [Fimbriimonas sp.]